MFNLKKDIISMNEPGLFSFDVVNSDNKNLKFFFNLKVNSFCYLYENFFQNKLHVCLFGNNFSNLNAHQKTLTLLIKSESRLYEMLVIAYNFFFCYA